MVKLNKDFLKRQTITSTHYLEDGDRLADIIEKLGEDAVVSVDGGWYGDDPDTWMVTSGRLETDEEYDKRIKEATERLEAQAKADALRKKEEEKKRNERERREYLRLRKKFENK